MIVEGHDPVFWHGAADEPCKNVRTTKPFCLHAGHIAWRGISFADLCAANPKIELPFGHRLSATPRFLAVLRVPARVLGNAMFSNGF